METVETLERVIPKFSWSEMTCGEGCWSAKIEECVCSCGGKNHGIWRTSKDARVQRTRKINNTLYKLVGVGTRGELREMQGGLLEKYGVLRCYDYYGKGDYIHQTYRDYLRCRNDSELTSFPVVLKNASDSELTRWKELTPFTKYSGHEYNQTIATLWEIFVIPTPCNHSCDKAKSIKIK
jgi:hypothetical protein